MKSIRGLLIFAAVAVITVPAFAIDPKVSFGGYVEIHYGVEQCKEKPAVGKETTTTSTGFDRADDFEFDLNADIDAGKLTGQVTYGAEGYDDGLQPAIENFWLGYQFAEGVSLTYDAVNSQNRWGEFEDICTDQDDAQSFDLTYHGAFLTLVGSNIAYDEDGNASAPGYKNGYSDTKTRKFPLCYFGYSDSIGEKIDLTVGGLFDKTEAEYKLIDEEGNPLHDSQGKQITDGAYTGWMGYINSTYWIFEDVDQVSFAAFYGVNSLFATNFKVEGEDEMYGNFSDSALGSFATNLGGKKDTMFGAMINFSIKKIDGMAYCVSGTKDKGAKAVDDGKDEIKLNYDFFTSIGYTYNLTEQLSIYPALEYINIKFKTAGVEYTTVAYNPYFDINYMFDDYFTIGGEIAYEIGSEDSDGKETYKWKTLSGQVNVQYSF